MTIPSRPWVLSNQYGMEFILSADNEIILSDRICKAIPEELRKFIVEAVNIHATQPSDTSAEEIGTP